MGVLRRYGTYLEITNTPGVSLAEGSAPFVTNTLCLNPEITAASIRIGNTAEELGGAAA